MVREKEGFYTFDHYLRIFEFHADAETRAGAQWRTHASENDRAQQQWDTESYNYWLSILARELNEPDTTVKSGLGVSRCLNDIY